MTWYYLSESREVVGPISENALRELNTAGILTGETQVCRKGTDEWIRLTEAFEVANPGDTESDTDNVSANDPMAFNGSEEPSGFAEESDGSAPKHSLSDRLKKEAKAGWVEIKRTSKAASVHAQIEKLKHVDLRMAFLTLGKRCYESGRLESELHSEFQLIRELDTTIAGKRETTEAEADETKMAALKRMGKDAAKASHAQALTVKRQHLLTELGRLAYERLRKESSQGLEAEIAEIDRIEGIIRIKEEEARTLGAGHAAGWKRTTPRIAVAAGVALLLIGGIFFGLRTTGGGKDDDFVTAKSEETLSGGENYQPNQADRQILKKFEELYEVSSTLGNRTGANELETLLGTIDAMDWRGASRQLKSAVKEIESIQSGEDPDGRNKKMQKFMDIYEKY